MEKVDDAMVALARTLADAIDAEHTAEDGSRYTVGALAGRLHPVIADLRGELVAPTDALDAALAAMSTTMDDATPT